MTNLICKNCNNVTYEKTEVRPKEKQYLTSKIVCENCGHELILANNNVDSNNNLLTEQLNESKNQDL